MKTLQEADGSESLSRKVLFGSVMFIGIVFAVVMIGMFFDFWDWDRFSGGLTWGRDFMFITILPYVSNVGSKALGKNNGTVDH